MKIFRQLRWQLTLSYTIVTVSAFLAITLILGGILFKQLFIPEQYFNPEQMIDAWMSNRVPSTNPMLSQILSQSPVDTKLLTLYIHDPQSNISSSSLFRIGALEFGVTTKASIRVLVIDPDGVLLGTSASNDHALSFAIGRPFDPAQVPGLEAPFKAALAGDTNPKHLYTMLEPNQRLVFAAPLFNRADGDPNRVVGAVVVLFDAVPTQKDIPMYILQLAGVGLVFFILGAGIMGALFGYYFAHRIATRFARLSTATDLWSEGNFSRYIDDTTGDEISQFAQRLDIMAKQLQGLLRRRQEMAVSEERNRLARDLHDSAKQQALAASLELGAAITVFERDQVSTKKHLVEADALVDSVRKELTNLVHELRPLDLDGQDFSETLKEYAIEWAQRTGIELDFRIEGSNELPLETRETLFRVAQEALANVARHSSAHHANVSLECGASLVRLSIKDDGVGFDTHALHRGIGLDSMAERARALGGSFGVESTARQGTRIVLTLPVEAGSF